MKIDTIRAGGSASVILQGRLDRECSEDLSDTLDDLLQKGVRSVNLDFSGVTYVSSPAIEVLVHCQERLAVLRGHIRLQALSPAVRQAIAVTGWDSIAVDGPASNTTAETRRTSWQTRIDFDTSGQYEMATDTATGTLTCRLYGDPSSLTWARVGPGDCSVVSLPETVFGLGVGAIGTSYEECHPQLGELVAVAGSVAYFPTDGARRADYLVGTGEGAAAPDAVLASGIICEGTFSQLIRFGTRPESASVPLSELVGVALEASGGQVAGVVIAAETACLTGTRLRRSPAPDGPLQFGIPAVHDWLEFAAEPSRVMTTTLIVGVVASAPQGPLAAHLRPVGGTGGLFAHLHAAVFAYHPLPQRKVRLTPLIKDTFANHPLRDVLHVVWDDRGEAGVGETTLVRGVAWTSPVTQVG